jgi:hypothetical protein
MSVFQVFGDGNNLGLLQNAAALRQPTDDLNLLVGLKISG